jgi:hypothetical protein
VIDGYPAGADIGERGVAVGATSVLIAAQRVPDTVMGPQAVGQRDALAAGPLIDEEAGLGGLAAAADVEGVDDVSEAGLKRTICLQSPVGVEAASWQHVAILS